MMDLLHSFAGMADGLYFSLSLIVLAGLGVATLIALFTRQIMRRQGLTCRRAFFSVASGLALFHLAAFLLNMDKLTDYALMGIPLFLYSFTGISAVTFLILRALTGTKSFARSQEAAQTQRVAHAQLTAHSSVLD